MLVLIVFIAFGCAKDEVTPVNGQQQDTVNVLTEKKTALQEKAIIAVDREQQEAKQDSEPEEEKNEKATVQEKSGQETNQQEEQANNSASTDSHKTSQEEKPTSENEGTASVKQQDRQKKEPTNQPAQKKQTKSEAKPDKKDDKEDKDDEKTPPKKEPEQPSSYVNFSIDAREVKGQIVPQTKVERKEGDTILDITRRILKQKGIQLSVRGANAGAYVEGIDNLYEFDEGQNSGWMIRLDGALIKQGVGATPVAEGQTIYWFYTTNYLEESGAGG